MNYCRQSWLASLLLLLVSSSQQQLGCHGFTYTFTSSTSSSSHSPNNKCTSYSSESTRNSLSNGRSMTLLFLHPDQAAELEEAAKKLLEKHRYCYNATLDEDINIDMSSSSTSTPSCSSSDGSDGSDGSSAVYDDTKFAQKSPLSVASASKRSAHAPLGPTAKWWSRTFSSFVRRHE